jgi:hypothetical protein
MAFPICSGQFGIQNFLYQNHFSEVAPATRQPKTVTIMEPVSVTLPSSATETVTFGRGKQLLFVARNGDQVIVRYLEDDVSVPISSTDLQTRR